MTAAALAPADPTLELLRLVRPALDRRLDPSARAPIAAAGKADGGGDSLALLLTALAWGGAHGRPVVALTVDHGLQPASAGWTRAAAAKARALGAQARSLAWTGPKPHAGLPAAARRARHALLAEAARAAGARVLLLGHTADDLAEAALMRAHGSSVGGPMEWSPSPAWPEGRGLYLLRPLLAVRRAHLRRMLAETGHDWLDDPANVDPAYARARARRALPGAASPAPEPGAALAALARAALCSEAGVVSIGRDALLGSDPGAAARFLAMACVSAGGGDRLPRRGRADDVLRRLRDAPSMVATLAGARSVGGPQILILREAGEADRGGLTAIELEPRSTGVWDGRFEAFAEADGWSLRPLRGLARRLPELEQSRLRAIPAAARAALPAAVRGEVVSCPILAGAGPVTLRCLIGARLAGACGVFAQERDLRRGPDGAGSPGALS